MTFKAIYDGSRRVSASSDARAADVEGQSSKLWEQLRSTNKTLDETRILHEG